MAWTLVQVRTCDQACCREGPRFPNENRSDCIYNDGTGNRSCALMRGDAIMPDEESKIFEGRTANEVYLETCVNWPGNTPDNDRHATKTGSCCWQWINDTVVNV